MQRTFAWALLALIGLAGAAAQAQNQEPPEVPVGGEPTPEPVFLFTPRIIELAIDRITDGMVGHYKLDEAQVWQAREAMKARFPQWLDEHRTDLIPLVNEYTEAMLSPDPPTPEQVAGWAKRVQPLVGEFTQLVEETTTEFRTFMTEEQQVILDGEMAVFRVGMNHMNGRLQVWSEGGYDWEYEWPRSQKFQQAQRDREEELHVEAARAKAEALGRELDGGPAVADGDQPTPTTAAASAGKGLDAWESYVAEFVRRYNLTEEQQAQARRVLRSLQEQRDRYLGRKLKDIETLETRLKAAQTNEDREQVRAEYNRLNEPIERMFSQLKDRLEPIPTRKQRREAAMKTELDERVKAEAAAGDKK